MRLQTILLLLLTTSLIKANGQGGPCTVHGQTPATAFPVCGTKDFVQENVPLCGNHSVPGCNTGDVNPFWYRFTCFKSGTLGFLIKPKGRDEDYDWQLFDITGHSPEEVYTNPNLTVTYNWAGTYGNTGASATGTYYLQCGSDPREMKPTFAKMPDIIQGHTYLLLISHFTETPLSGYSLSFNGGTASITDTLPPNLVNAVANCDGSAVTIALNKRMKCISLASDGSDFSIDARGIDVVSAEAVSCTSGFDMDNVVIKLSKALSPGNYKIKVKAGSDDNTILDNCDNGIPEDASVTVSVLPKQPTPMDSITTPTCAPQTLQLVFAKPMNCSSIAEDGSDFVVTGPSPVTIAGATGNCTDEVSNIITVKLTTPIVDRGTYTITLKNGADGNTLIDECGQITPAGSSLSFSVKDTVSAMFNAKLLYGCTWDTIAVTHDGNNGTNQWDWSFDGNYTRSGTTAQIAYNTYGEKTIQLIVSNGFCSDTAATTLNLDNELKAFINGPSVICPADPVTFTDGSIGNIIEYKWNFGFAQTYQQKLPPIQYYPQTDGDKTYNATLIVQNDHHCYDTALQVIKVPYSCYIAVPSAFTPNSDGRNDFLYPLNAYKADNVNFRVYNRYGQLVFHTTNWLQKWNGTINGQQAAPGTYVWYLSYTHHDTGKLYFSKGTTVLIR